MTEKRLELPSEALVQKMRRLIVKPDEAEAVKLLKENPDLAYTGEAWHGAFPKQDPFIYDAVEHAMPDLLKALLDEGADPNIPLDNRKYIDLLHMAMAESNYSDRTLTCAELLAHHPRTHLYYKHISGAMISHAEIASLLFAYSPSEESLERRKALFSHLLDHIPAECARAAQNLFHEALSGVAGKGNTKARHIVTMAQLLVNHGCSPNLPWTEEMVVHVATEVNELTGDAETAEALAGFMAAGMRKDCLIGPVNHDQPITLGEHLSHLSKGTREEKACASQVVKRLGEILKAEIAQVTCGKVSPEQLLFTPKGGPSWQAQGLTAHARIEDLFNKKHAARFGGGEQQREFAFRLHDALSEDLRGYFNVPRMLREEALAQPDNAATVRYLRGADVTTGKGAA